MIPESDTLQGRIDSGEVAFLVRPQDMITMAAAFARNDNLECAAIIQSHFPYLFPSEE